MSLSEHHGFQSGLSALTESHGRLLSDAELAEAGPPEAVRLPLDLVDPSPHNPRKHLLEIEELSENIRAFGLLQPITVRRRENRYEIIGGHRRFAAFQHLRDLAPQEVQWRSIPAVVRTADDDRAYLMLISGQAHVANWHPREQAAALERLALTGIELKEIGQRINRTEGWVSRRLRVFADSILSGYVQSGRLLPSIAEELLPVKDAETKRRLAEEAVAQRWSQDQIKGRVRALRLDRQLSQIGKVARTLVELLSSVDPRHIPLEVTRDLWVIHGRIEVLARGAERRVPTIEEAQRAARVRSQERPLKRGEKRKPGYTPRLRE